MTSRMTSTWLTSIWRLRTSAIRFPTFSRQALLLEAIWGYSRLLGRPLAGWSRTAEWRAEASWKETWMGNTTRPGQSTSSDSLKSTTRQALTSGAQRSKMSPPPDWTHFGSGRPWWDCMFFTIERQVFQYLSAAMERDFLKGTLGPALRSSPFAQNLSIMIVDDQRSNLPAWPDTVSQFTHSIERPWSGLFCADSVGPRCSQVREWNCSALVRGRRDKPFSAHSNTSKSSQLLHLRNWSLHGLFAATGTSWVGLVVQGWTICKWSDSGE